MPTLFVFFGLRFMFYSNEHEPPHLHVIKGKGPIKEWAVYQVAPEIALTENHGLKSNELKLAEMVIEENRDIILANWKRYFNKNGNDN